MKLEAQHQGSMGVVGAKRNNTTLPETPAVIIFADSLYHLYKLRRALEFLSLGSLKVMELSESIALEGTTHTLSTPATNSSHYKFSRQSDVLLCSDETICDISPDKAFMVINYDVPKNATIFANRLKTCSHPSNYNLFITMINDNDKILFHFRQYNQLLDQITSNRPPQPPQPLSPEDFSTVTSASSTSPPPPPPPPPPPRPKPLPLPHLLTPRHKTNPSPPPPRPIQHVLHQNCPNFNHSYYSLPNIYPAVIRQGLSKSHQI